MERIERYYDAAPRVASRVEDLPPFVLFVKQGAGWPYYARPAIGARAFLPEDVSRVRARQRVLGMPEAFEWVAETSPSLLDAARAAGLRVGEHPLMVLDGTSIGRVESPNGITVRLVSEEDNLAHLNTVVHVGFSFAGTARGDAGPERVAEMIEERKREEDAFLQDRLRRGLTVMAVALANGVPVAGGSHQPVGEVTEIVGVATLPVFRRRGIGAALTNFLADDARRRGVPTVFLSAGGDEIARVYERVGFRRVGTACVAEPEEG